MKFSLSSLLLGASLLAFGTAHAEDIYAVLPPHQIDGAGTLETIVQAVWDETGRGDSLTIIDGQSTETILNLRIPDQGRYDVARLKVAAFRTELGALRRAVISANETAAPAPVDWQTNVVGALDRIAELRTASQEPGRVLLFGSPLQRVDYNPQLSMIGPDGDIRVANDGLIEGERRLSPYGKPVQDDGLSGLSFHVCAVLPPASPHQISEVSRQWSLIIDQQGGTLTTFTTDHTACLVRFENRVEAPVAIRPLETSIGPAMISTGLSGAVGQITEERIDVLIDERDAAQAELETLREALGQSDEAEATEAQTFSQFTYVQHPVIEGESVITGVSYDGGFPDHYVDSWCYFHARTREGAQIRISVGTKAPGRPISWQVPNASVLRSAGITQQDQEAARQACRFRQD